MTQEKKTLSLFQTLTYSSGQLSGMLINQVIVTWAMYFYAPSVKEGACSTTTTAIAFAPLVMLGYAMGFGRIVDAVADPVVGYWSDRSRSRLGRRIPFVVFGTPFLILFFILLWKPPVAHVSNLNTLYFALILGGFFFFYTIVVAPYLSLMPEIARTDRERMSTATFQAVFGIAGLIIAALVAPAIIGKDLQYMKMGLIMGAVCLVFFYVSIAFVRETEKPPEQAETFKFTQAMAETLKNKAFVSWVVCIFMFWVGFNVIMMSTPYYVTAVLGQCEEDAGSYQGILMGGTVPLFFIVFLLSKKFNKKTLIAVAMIMFTLFTPLFYFTRMVPHDFMRTYAMIVFGILAVPVSILLIMANAIIADIVDIDELRTGRRREAMYFGMQGLATKFAIAISSVVGALLMEYFGRSAENPLGILLTGPFCAIFTFIGLLAILAYPSQKPAAK